MHSNDLCDKLVTHKKNKETFEMHFFYKHRVIKHKKEKEKKIQPSQVFKADDIMIIARIFEN